MASPAVFLRPGKLADGGRVRPGGSWPGAPRPTAARALRVLSSVPSLFVPGRTKGLRLSGSESVSRSRP